MFELSYLLPGLTQGDGRVLPDGDALALTVDRPQHHERLGALPNPEPKARGEGVAVLGLSAGGRFQSPKGGVLEGNAPRIRFHLGSSVSCGMTMQDAAP